MTAGAVLSMQPLRAAGIVKALGVTVASALLGVPMWSLTGRLAHATPRRATAWYVLAGVLYAAALPYFIHRVSVAVGTDDPAWPVSPWNTTQLLLCVLIYLCMLAAMLTARSSMRAEASRRSADAAHRARVAAESLQARAELQVLRAHLDPHFLFNTLNAIAAVVETDAARARQMLVRAGALLRRVLDLGSSGNDTMSLAEEWAIASEYLAFERLRMGDRLRVDAEFTEAALDCEIPALILQPLVENAIRHGLFPRPLGGTLRVSGMVEGEVLRIEVADDGDGSTTETVERAGGFGLRATRQRIDGAYLGAGRVEIETAPGLGFRVRLTMPSELPALSPLAAVSGA